MPSVDIAYSSKTVLSLKEKTHLLESKVTNLELDLVHETQRIQALSQKLDRFERELKERIEILENEVQR